MGPIHPAAVISIFYTEYAPRIDKTIFQILENSAAAKFTCRIPIQIDIFGGEKQSYEHTLRVPAFQKLGISIVVDGGGIYGVICTELDTVSSSNPHK